MVTVWKIAPGSRALVWDDCYQRGCISVNWLNRTDYSSFRDRREIRRALISDDPHEGTGGGPSIWRFTYEVKQGHVVIANDGLSRVKGIGVVASGYLPPEDRRNPNRNQDYHRHVRLVDWVINKPIDLGKEVFIQPTVQLLGPEECTDVRRAYLKEDRNLEKALNRLFDKELTRDHLGPAEDEGTVDPEYVASNRDLRKIAWRQITTRRGQPQFRNMLLQRYGRRCLVTGCKVVAVLEAAHIDPYRSDVHHHLGNGLVLRADIHTLFDLNLLGIEPDGLRVELHPDIAETYGGIVRKTLACDDHCRPLHEALERRYKSFKRRCKWPA